MEKVYYLIPEKKWGLKNKKTGTHICTSSVFFWQDTAERVFKPKKYISYNVIYVIDFER